MWDLESYTERHQFSFCPIVVQTEEHSVPGLTNTLARAACVRCHGTKCTLLTALFIFLSFFCRVTFIQEVTKKLDFG
jgi:hypothetical protein